MSTKDQTLLQFLSGFDLGEVQVMSTDVLKSFGHTAESAANVELLIFTLKRPFEVGELPSLAASYLIRAGYERVNVTKQKLTGTVPIGFQVCGGFDEGSLIVGESPGEGRVVITVSYTKELASFVKQFAGEGAR